jgi:hypothetical protein
MPGSAREIEWPNSSSAPVPSVTAVLGIVVPEPKAKIPVQAIMDGA